MIVRFDEEFALPVAEIYSYFRTPADWSRLYGLAGGVRELSGGWYAVPLHRFPFPLVARNLIAEPDRHVRWMFRGFWRGEGEVRFTSTARGTRVVGFEEIGVRWLFGLSPWFERRFLERPFRSIWEIGWRRLRKREAGAPESGAASRAAG